jgi:ketosteroid isomerase-like protein
MRPAEVAAAFVARINEHDLAALNELMTDDHVFIDALDNHVVGRAAMRAGWEHYFTLVPDYWIKVESTLQDDRVVALFGVAGGTYAGGISGGQKGSWKVPAAWLAEIRDGRVAMWRVYADNLPIRRLMGVERHEGTPQL